MEEQSEQQPVIRLECICEYEVTVPPEKLGSCIRCKQCGRYLRPSLHFVLLEPGLADNLTGVCTCGRLVVQKPSKSGKTATCRGCRQRLAMPEPIYRASDDGVVPVPPKHLKKRLGRTGSEERQEESPLDRLKTAARAGRITLRPGENICANPECGALLAPGATVCPKCGTNFLTGRIYRGNGPDADPVGKWKGPP